MKKIVFLILIQVLSNLFLQAESIQNKSVNQNNTGGEEILIDEGKLVNCFGGYLGRFDSQKISIGMNDEKNRNFQVRITKNNDEFLARFINSKNDNEFMDVKIHQAGDTYKFMEENKPNFYMMKFRNFYSKVNSSIKPALLPSASDYGNVDWAGIKDKYAKNQQVDLHEGNFNLPSKNTPYYRNNFPSDFPYKIERTYNFDGKICTVTSLSFSIFPWVMYIKDSLNFSIDKNVVIAIEEINTDLNIYKSYNFLDVHEREFIGSKTINGTSFAVTWNADIYKNGEGFNPAVVDLLNKKFESLVPEKKNIYFKSMDYSLYYYEKPYTENIVFDSNSQKCKKMQDIIVYDGDVNKYIGIATRSSEDKVDLGSLLGVLKYEYSNGVFSASETSSEKEIAWIHNLRDNRQPVLSYPAVFFSYINSLKEPVRSIKEKMQDSVYSYSFNEKLKLGIVPEINDKNIDLHNMEFEVIGTKYYKLLENGTIDIYTRSEGIKKSSNNNTASNIKLINFIIENYNPADKNIINKSEYKQVVEFESGGENSKKYSTYIQKLSIE